MFADGRDVGIDYLEFFQLQQTLFPKIK